MNTCPSCGKDLPPGDFPFCPFCTAPLETAPASREQRKTVTVLFCDVTGSTALGESTDPEALRSLLARYFERMKGIVEAHEGTVEKFIGDAVMAVFGVPQVHEDDALRACRAAVEMRDALPDLGLQARIGVNTGEVVTGTEERLATGDAVNVAARLEQAAQPGEILLGQPTLAFVREAVKVKELKPRELKGKAEPVAAFQLLSVGAEETPRHEAPMVGRETELRRLLDAYDQAVHDRACQLFTVLGAAGVGKSRLVAEFLARLTNAVVARGRCLPYGEGITYWPMVEALKQLPEVETDSVAADTLEALLRDQPMASSSEEIAWAFRKRLEAVAQERPLVCVFDDLHWGEETFLDLVEHVADLSRNAPIVVLCIARPDLLDRHSGWAGGKINATNVLLEPLSPKESEQLIESLAHMDEGLRERIQQAAEGNPLFVEEMVALAKESDEGEVSVPPTIQALLAARLDQLEAPERSVLERGAIEGRVFHRGAVQALSPHEPSVVDRLTSLVRKELVRPDKSQIPGEDAFRFRHLLIRDAAYDALPKATRAVLHERFAGWLEEHGTGLVELDEIVGYHLEHAYRYRAELGSLDDPAMQLGRQAAERLTSAGRGAAARGDTPAAANLLQRAADLLAVDDPRRPGLLVELADVLVPAGNFARSEQLLDEALTTARAERDRRTELHAVIARERVLIFTRPEGVLERIPGIVDDAIPIFEDMNDNLGLARAWTLRSEVGWMACHFEDSAVALERALHHIERVGDRRKEVELRGRLAAAWMAGPMPVEDAIRRCEGALQSTKGNSLLETLALPAVAIFEAYRGNFDRARELIGQREEIVGQFGLMLALAASKHVSAQIEMLADDPVSAEQKWRESCDIFIAMEERSYLSTRAAELAEKALYAQGKYDETERFAELGRAAGASDDIETQARWRGALAKVLAYRGEGRRAEEVAGEAVAIVETTDDLVLQGDVLMDMAEVLRLLDRPGETRATLEQALERYERKGNLVMAERTRARLVQSPA